MVVSLILFASALHLAHSLYLQPSWEYLGMTFAVPSWHAYTLGLALIILAGLAAPLKFSAPSSVFIMALLFIVFVPTVVITLAVRADALDHYGREVLAFSIAFFTACLVCRSDDKSTSRGPLPGPLFVRCLLAVWLLGSLVTLFVYRDTLRIVSFGDVYQQRAAGQTSSAAVAYLQTYYLNVVCPAVLAIGLLDRKRWWMILVALTGFGLAYSVAAQKTALFIPFVMLGIYVAMTTLGRLLGLTCTIAVVLAGSIGLGIWMFLSMGSNWFSAIVVHRTIAIPGLTMSQYSDFFREVGYTMWGHVRGVSALVPIPEALRTNPLWPSIGYLVGEHAYGDATHNLNANLFSSDGVAAGGYLGLLGIGAIFAIWLRTLDWCGNGWNRQFVALVLLPVAVSLTNGPFFTVMLSFGGIFWTILFAVYKPMNEVPVPNAEAPQAQQATAA